MARNKFSDASAKCRQDLQILPPRWRVQMPISALNSRVSTTSRGMLAILDSLATKSLCRARRETVADRAGLTDRQVRTAITDLTKAGYVQRQRKGGYCWEWRLLRRNPSTWAPGWAPAWMHIHPDLQLKHLVLYMAVIANTPQGELGNDLASWCEVPAPKLAEQAQITRNSVPEALSTLAEAGLVLLMQRPGRPTIVCPTVEPETINERQHRAECVADILFDREGERGTEELRLIGLDAPYILDDPGMQNVLAKFTSGNVQAIQHLTATGRTQLTEAAR